MRDVLNLRSQVKFISNDIDSKTKVLKPIQRELERCDAFSISVAFITKGGLTMLANQLLELKNNNIKGRILTSTYQYFNQPQMFEKLLTYPNIEVRVYSLQNHHTKGYIFKKDSKHKIFIGSSNLTESALAINREWNLEVSQKTNSELVSNVMNEFESMWQQAEIVDDRWIEDYREVYSQVEINNIQAPVQRQEVKPNSMQQTALRNLKYLRDQKENKALLISATGTGKTFLAAFDVNQSKAKKALFVIHREQIARDAMRTFKKVMPLKTMGLLSGTSKEVDREFIFTTIQTLSKPNVYQQFSPDYFDYIIYDEAHRSGASSYQSVLNYFKPKFQLGMSATPERNDEINVFELFDYNIAHEIRLQSALEQNMVTPFHYFGISDVTYNGGLIDDQSTIEQLIHQQRIDTVVEKAQYYGYSGKRVKGLIFCSRNEEAGILSEKLNQRGLLTISLNGSHSQEEREAAIKQLESDQRLLDYIISVDIFNEGVDIPKVNQVIMLRPTQSATIFVQQLGRGLRKDKEKEYVVVIDFIGNYKNNFMIPIALSGDKSLSKNTLRKFVQEGTQLLPGTSTIEFDRITKEQIFRKVDQENFSTLKHLKKSYFDLKYRIGRIPSLLDYVESGSIDPQVIFQNSKFRNHVQFLEQVDEEFNSQLTVRQHQTLSFISQEFSSGKRKIEIDILTRLINQQIIDEKDLFNAYDHKEVASAINYLQKNFIQPKDQQHYSQIELINYSNKILSISSKFNEDLMSLSFKTHLEDVFDYSYHRYKNWYQQTDQLGFVVGEQYTRKDACWLLNWTRNEQSTIYGYKVDHKSQSIPIFVTYAKDEQIDETIKYDDAFINHDTFQWMSRNKRVVESPEIQSIIHAKKLGYSISLFIKRSDGESKFFYYCGQVEVLEYEQTMISANGKKLPIVSFEFKLLSKIPDDLYYYFIES